jgi:hypothetical protein
MQEPQRSCRMKFGSVFPAEERQVTNRTHGGPAADGWAGSRATLGLVGLRWRQDEKRRLVVHLRGLLPRASPTPAPAASPPVHRQLTPRTWPSSSSGHQPVKSPRQSLYTSGIHSAKAAYRGNGRPKPSQFIGRQSPGRRAKWERLTMTVPIAAVHRGRWLRAPDRLVVSVRWCILKSIRGTQYNDESGALPS